MADRHDYTWRWDTERSDGGIVVDDIAFEPGIPEYTDGKRIRLTLEFWNTAQTFATKTGGTFGGSTGGTFGGTTGMTYGTSTLITDTLERYKAVRKYGIEAGKYAPFEAGDGTLHYLEQLPSSPAVPSIVVPIEPSQNLKDEATEGLWIILDEYDDQTTRIANGPILEFRATVLAKFSEYGDRTAIHDDLG